MNELARNTSKSFHGHLVLDLKIVDLLWLITFNVLLFEPLLQDLFVGLNAADEIASGVILAVALGRLTARKKRDTSLLSMSLERAAMGLTLLVVAIGLLGNILYQVQPDIVPVAIDMFTCVKFVAAVLSAIIVFEGKSRLTSVLLVEFKVLVSIMLICGILNLFLDIGMSLEVRYGIKSFNFILPHPTFLNMALVGMLLIFVRDAKANRVWITFDLIVMVLTLRSKALGFVIAAILFLWIFRSGKGRITALHILIAIAVVAIVGWDQFQYYYDSDGFARTELSRASAQVANDFFPIGSGFGTFGSAITAKTEYYSPLYYTYGLSAVEGISPRHSSFIADTFWPTVIGQFGWFGCIIFVLSVGVLSYALYKRGLDKGVPLVPILGIVYLLISSTSESAFFNPSSVFLAFCIGISIVNQSAKVPMEELSSGHLKKPVSSESGMNPF